MAGPLYYPPSSNNLQKTLNADYTASDSVITLNNTTNVQNKPGVVLINRVDSSGNLQAAADWTFIKFTGTSGATLTGCSEVSNDQDHALGEVVEFIFDVTQGQAIADALANLVDTTTLALDTTKVVDLATAQTLTNKTLTSPVLNNPTGTGLVTTSSTDTLTNKTLTSPIINTPTLTLTDATTMTTDGGILFDRTNEKLLIGDGTNTQSVKMGSWTSFTPTVSGAVSSIGNATFSCAYSQVGKLVVAKYKITFGNTTSFTSGNMTISLPVTSASNDCYLGPANFVDYGTNSYIGVFLWSSTTTMLCIVGNAAGTYTVNTTVTNTVPHTWANTDIITGTIVYEAA